MLDNRDPNLEQLIGDVAEAMTSTPPDTRFAQQVSARIAAAGPRRAAWAKPWLLVPIASACALLLVVFVGWPFSVGRPSSAGPPLSVGRPFQGRHAGTESPAPQKPDAAAPVAKVEQPAPRRRGPQRAARPTGRLPALPPLTIAPLEVDRLDVQPLVQMDDIPIIAIAIDRIEIAAMP